MRADMRHVVAKGHHNSERYDGKRHTRLNSLERLENLPERESMRKHWAGWHSRRGPNCTPMIRFLGSRVGKLWTDVYREICERATGLRGREMKRVLDWFVDIVGNDVTRDFRGYRDEFYVDDDGILRLEKARRSRWRQRNQKQDPDKFCIGDRRFERINGCWFEVWYEVADRNHWRWCPISQERYLVYSKGEYMSHKKQLSKKEMKAVKVSNDPEFIWWKK